MVRMERLIMDTKSLTPQQLGLVLGCEATFEFKDGYKPWPEVCILTSYLLSQFERFPKRILSVKPHLRKLESITEEEFEEIFPDGNYEGAKKEGFLVNVPCFTPSQIIELIRLRFDLNLFPEGTYILKD